MILDKQNLFSDDQAVTTTAVSTNVIDLGVAGANKGEPIDILVQVTTTFAGGTSIQLGVGCDTVAAFSSETTLQTTAAIALASLVQGYQFTVSVIPTGVERFMRLTYTVVGTMTAGNITAGLVLDRQTNNV
jgi:hypothetical protein